ncbi:MAG: transcriptional repressor LexA [Verrucomicrobia subdivision 3 bacterium]|nr:transcriptional repressor LexA [Limisphaerales bacterium]
MNELTQIQRRVFEFVRDKLASGDPAPTPREIAAKFGWSSKRAAECHIEALIRKGWLTSEPGKARSLRLADSAQSVRRAVFELPVFGTIPAGFGSEREQEADECIPVTIDSIGLKPTRNTFALRVNGDSMVGRHICDGDIVVLEHGPDPRPGQIVAALIDRKSTLKTFVMKNGKPFLKAENPRYPNLIPSEELMIQGVFRALIRRDGE